MDGMLKTLRASYKEFWIKDNIRSFCIGLFFFAIAKLIQVAADTYVSRLQGVPLNDVFLDHLPRPDIDSFIIQSALLLTFMILLLVIFKPKYLNFALKSLALFIIVRSLLITLTHLGTNPHQLVFDKNSFGYGLYNVLYNTKNDYFFSGHAGIPFLMALIFWPEKKWRFFFIFSSFVFGASVLLARIHYSIDVFAAPFITHSIFSLSSHLFSDDYKLSRRSS